MFEIIQDKINQIDKNTINKFFMMYMDEFFQVFVAILIIRIAMDKNIDLYKIVVISAIIALVTLMLEYYNSDFNSNIKQGITFTAGSQMISGFMND